MPTRWPSSGRGRLVRGCDCSSAGAAAVSGAASKSAAAAGASGGATPAASAGGAAPAGSSAAPPSCVAAAPSFPAPPSWAASGGSAGPGAPACLSAPSLVKLFIEVAVAALTRLAGTRRAARTASRRRTLVKTRSDQHRHNKTPKVFGSASSHLPLTKPIHQRAPGHDDDDDARFYDRQQAYVHARGG